MRLSPWPEKGAPKISPVEGIDYKEGKKVTIEYCDRCKTAKKRNEKFNIFRIEGGSYRIYGRASIGFTLCEKCEKDLGLNELIEKNAGKMREETGQDVKDRVFDAVKEILQIVAEEK